MILYYLYSLLLITANTAALDNGVALTPPMGFNSYMSSALQNEQGLRKAAEFIVNSGMRDLGYKYINTDGISAQEHVASVWYLRSCFGCFLWRETWAVVF